MTFWTKGTKEQDTTENSNRRQSGAAVLSNTASVNCRHKQKIYRIIVADANSLKRFETRLDKFWRDQDVMFDWTAEITGTGDRSEFKLETVLEKKTI